MYADADPVLDWSLEPRRNVRWETEVGQGHSSPVVVSDRVLVTSEPDALLCIDRADGEVLWRRSSTFDDLPGGARARVDEEKKKPETRSGYATPTPASDGRRAYVFYGTGIVARYDLGGTRDWIVFLDYPQTTDEGRTVSPVLADGKLIVQPSRLVALDPGTGDTLWAIDDDAIPCVYGTPVAARIGEVDVLVTPSGGVVRVSDGGILATGLGECVFTSPVVEEGVVYFIDGTACAVALPEKVTDRTKTEDFAELWYAELAPAPYSSPVHYRGMIYTVTQDAHYHVMDAATGEVVLRKRLGLLPAGRSGGDVGVYPSVAFAGKHLFLSNDAGDSLVLEPGRDCREVARVAFGDGSAASPVFAGKDMFLRGQRKLYCMGR